MILVKNKLNICNVSPFDLNSKTALITGTAGLLGIEHAKVLLETGAIVVLTDLNERNLVKAYDSLKTEENKNRIHYKVMDVTRRENIDDMNGQNIVMDGGRSVL